MSKASNGNKKNHKSKVLTKQNKNKEEIKKMIKNTTILRKRSNKTISKEADQIVPDYFGEVISEDRR